MCVLFTFQLCVMHVNGVVIDLKERFSCGDMIQHKSCHKDVIKLCSSHFCGEIHQWMCKPRSPCTCWDVGRHHFPVRFLSVAPKAQPHAGLKLGLSTHPSQSLPCNPLRNNYDGKNAGEQLMHSAHSGMHSPGLKKNKTKKKQGGGLEGGCGTREGGCPC